MDRPQPLPPMLRSILEAASAKFPAHDWASVEEHVRRAWNSVAHDHAWEQVRDAAQREWERRAPPP
ncbi:MAG TPA: hypothetical protein VFT52_02885 [Luteimonas sp.]|nr:hypothetical protein [Luteimonas sp.]